MTVQKLVVSSADATVPDIAVKVAPKVKTVSVCVLQQCPPMLPPH